MRQAETVGRRERCSVRLTRLGKMQRSVHRQLKQALIANTTATAVLGQLFFVYRPHHLSVQPHPLRRRLTHLASSRSTCRLSFMILRAASIWRSKSAS